MGSEKSHLATLVLRTHLTDESLLVPPGVVEPLQLQRHDVLQGQGLAYSYNLY